MNLNIHTSGFTLTDSLRLHLEKRLAAALRPFSKKIATMTARLSDINARRGGIDKRCALVAVLAHRILVAEALHADAYTSIDCAAARLRNVLSRALARHSQIRRHQPRRS